MLAAESPQLGTGTDTVCPLTAQRSGIKHNGRADRGGNAGGGSAVKPPPSAGAAAWMKSFNLTVRSAEDDGEQRQSHRDEGHVARWKHHHRSWV